MILDHIYTYIRLRTFSGLYLQMVLKVAAQLQRSLSLVSQFKICRFILYSLLFALRSSLFLVSSSLFLLRSSLFLILRSSFFILHFSFFILYSLSFIPYSLLFTLYSLLFTLYSLFFTFYSLFFTQSLFFQIGWSSSGLLVSQLASQLTWSSRQGR